MRSNGMKRALGIAAFAAPIMLCAAAGVTACEKSKLDLGKGKTVEIGCDKLSIAFLSPGSNNEYLQAAIRGVEEAAAEAGANIEVFDAGWDAETQANQAQNVIAAGKFNAIIAESVDGNQACKVFSEEAPKANILVVTKNAPICGRQTKSGDEYWTPGTLSYVGGTQGVAESQEWLEQIVKENPGPQKVAMLTGGDLNSNTINMNEAEKAIRAAHPDFNIIADIRTDYTVKDGNEKTQALLQANPDLTVIISNYSDPTRGVVQAVKQAGLGGKIKVYDLGGNKWAFKALEAGDLTSTRTLTPYTEGKKAVEALAAAWAGKPVDKHVPLEAALVTPNNASQHQPEF
jgi:ribose transport system substrate-binding protein